MDISILQISKRDLHTQSVTRICYSCFDSCESLTHIDLPNSVIEIGDSAFYNCNSLEKIVIPNSVTHIGKFAFLRCNSLIN